METDIGSPIIYWNYFDLLEWMLYLCCMGKHKPKELGVNPFLSTFRNRVAIIDNKVSLTDDENKVTSNGTTIGFLGDNASYTKRLVIEADNSITEYFNHGSFSCTDVVLKLPAKALRMYEYIKLKVRKDDTIVPIEFAEYKDATGVTSYSTFTSDRAELVRAGIIAPTMHAIWFWTNPVFFFKGHRIKIGRAHV